MLTSLFMNTLLCLSFVHLIIEPKVGLEFDLFTKQTNTNKVFSRVRLKLSKKKARVIHKQLSLFTTQYFKNVIMT